MKDIVKHLGDDWWEEALRFFMAEIDDQGFDGFMNALFHAEISKDLSVKQQTLLRTLIGDARQRSINALTKCLNDGRLKDNKKRYCLDCLKTIGTDQAMEVISQYRAKAEAGAARALAEEIIAEETVTVSATATVAASLLRGLERSLRNGHEFNAEYILIPSGSYDYTVEDKTQTVQVPELYFAKYPVTNQRYRRFIQYLAGGEEPLQRILPCTEFSKQLFEFAPGSEISGMVEYFGRDAGELPEKLQSGYDTEKRFDGADQPVVGVTWYAARAYCLWLSVLLEATGGGPELEYRLPQEQEWQWAAAGEGNERGYPWGKNEPTQE